MIIRLDEKYRDKVENALLYLPKEKVEKYVEIDKGMKIYYMENIVSIEDMDGALISFVSNFLI